MTTHVSRIGPDNWAVWREMRLAALSDAPEAFAVTLAAAQAYSEETWREITRGGLTAVAFHGPAPTGMIGAYLSETRPGTVELVGMWVQPSARGGGTAEVLVDEVFAWAGEQGRPSVGLFVTEGNDRARRLYERLGFVRTGERMTMPGSSGLQCHRMLSRTDQGCR